MDGLIFLDSDGFTEIFGKNLGNIIAGATFDKKLFVQNAKPRETGIITGTILQYGESDLNTLLRWALCPDTLSCPFDVEAALVAGGSLVEDTEYFYHIEAYNSLGETAGSFEVSATPDAVNKSIKLTWSKIVGAEGYTIYRSTNNQDFTNSRRAVIEDPDILEWTDTGQAPDPSGPYSFPGINTDFDLPSENTTAGEAPDYGSAPALGTADLSIGVLGIGEQKAFWIGVVSTVATPESENPRNAILDFTEAL